MFCYHNQLLPPTFLNLFVTRSQEHNWFNYNLKGNYHFHFPLCQEVLKPIKNRCCLGYLFAKDNKRHVVVIILVTLNSVAQTLYKKKPLLDIIMLRGFFSE